MKKIIPFTLLIFISGFCSAQKTNDNCECLEHITINTFNLPAQGDKDEQQGNVVGEYEIDSVCIASNPKIIQSLGPLYDKEVLRVLGLMILNHNKCTSRRQFYACEKKKIRMLFNFNSDN